MGQRLGTGVFRQNDPASHAGFNRHINQARQILYNANLKPGQVRPELSDSPHAEIVQHQSLNAGLSPGRISRQTSAHHATNTVLSCSPGQESLVRRGTRVNLVVSVRPARQTPQVSKCTVPNVMNMTKEAALARLKQYRLNGIVDLQMSGNFVSKQVPSAGTVVPCGSTIRLNIGTLY